MYKLFLNLNERTLFTYPHLAKYEKQLDISCPFCLTGVRRQPQRRRVLEITEEQVTGVARLCFICFTCLLHAVDGLALSHFFIIF